MNATAQVTSAQARAKLEGMRRSLKAWLEYRQKVDAVANGKAKGKTAPDVLRAQLRAERFEEEDALAGQLYTLLSQVMDAQQLPSPDVREDPNAAAKLAVIAILGRAEGEAQLPGPQGAFSPGTIWPIAIVAGVVLLAMHGISSAADVAKEKERLRCIREGACTDTGFWLKWGAIIGVGLFGYKTFVKPASGGGRRGR